MGRLMLPSIERGVHGVVALLHECDRFYTTQYSHIRVRVLHTIEQAPDSS